jgi:c(7)-type cytochrome triheme protein
MGGPYVRRLGLLAGLAIGLVGIWGVEAQVKIPPDLTFEKGKESPGPVTFSHAKHRDAGNDKCPACHTRVFKMKRGQTGPLTMEKMKAGEQCGTCHNGKTQVAGKVVFVASDKANCERCHKKS